MSTILITGNTYPVRAELRALGGTWNKVKQGWAVPYHAEDRARQLVAGAATHYREPAGFIARDNSSHEYSQCGDIAYWRPRL